MFKQNNIKWVYTYRDPRTFCLRSILNFYQSIISYPLVLKSNFLHVWPYVSFLFSLRQGFPSLLEVHAHPLFLSCS
jgi:hypothetical protein